MKIYKNIEIKRLHRVHTVASSHENIYQNFANYFIKTKKYKLVYDL